MPTVPIRIPQLGEGLAEAILVEFLVEPGGTVKRDDPIYVMETDKANSEVESPYDGTVVSWTVEPGSVLPIGAEVGTMEVAKGVKEVGGGHGTPPPPPEAARVETNAVPTAATQEPLAEGGGTKLTPIRIPQLGEGLAEAVLVEYLKQPGDAVKRDDPLYTMETDKANSDVESPFDGVVESWSAEPGSVLPIGAEVGMMRVAADTKAMAAGHGPADDHSDTASSNNGTTSAGESEAMPGVPGVRILMPPRTRKLLRDNGLLEDAGKIAMAGDKLMPADVERYLAGDTAPPRPKPAAGNDPFDEAPLPTKQQTLNYRLIRGAQVCVPVVVVTDADWSRMDAARAAVKQAGEGGPTAFAMMLWCVTQVMKKHPGMRSSLDSTGKILRTYKHVNLGIAVALPGDLMVTAVVKNADTLEPAAFYDAVAERIAVAREGKDQADASTTLTVSNMGTAGMELGIPAVVAPAVATLVLGKTFWQPVPDGDGGFDFKKMAKLTLAFDHRIVNGVGGGHFVGDVKQAIESFELASATAAT